MATISKEDMAHIGLGILHPKLRYRFQVLFQEPDTDAPPAENYPLTPISVQITKVYLPAQRFSLAKLGMIAGDLVQFEYDDDVISSAVRAITAAGDNGTKFDMVVAVKDGDDVTLEEIKFRGCKFVDSQHLDALDYRCSDAVRRIVTVAFETREDTYPPKPALK
jgi:hypothetical protein